jgi:outer membrane protein assembly factor BamB
MPGLSIEGPYGRAMDESLPKISWRIPMIVGVVAATIIGIVHVSERIESYVAAYLIPCIVLLAAFSILIWFRQSPGFRETTRRRGTWIFVGSVLLVAGVGKLAARREGVISGVGFPRLVWRWSPRLGDDLPPIAVSHQTVDLSTTTSDDFPEFLGPGRRNAVEGVVLSRDWSKPPRLLWQKPIGLGWSSFAVVGSSAITQEQRGDSELVVCYDLATGNPVWSHSHDHTRFVDSQGGDGPRATPTISGGRVYAMGATGILDCLDGATGNSIWSQAVLPSPENNVVWGKSCSPLIVDDLVTVTGGRNGPTLIAYHKNDGSLAWSNGTDTPAYASPMLATLAGIRQIVTMNVGGVTAHDPADGRLLWRFDWPNRMPKNVQPIAVDADHLLLSAGYSMGSLVLQLEPSNGAIKTSTIWTSRHLRPKFSNSVIYKNCVYGIDDPPAMTCLELSTGKRMWRDGSYGFGQLLRVGNLMLVECESGEVALVDPQPDALHELGRFKALKDRTWSGPALVGHRLLVRNDQEAACYELP